jgi:Protein of unknown function (DUF3311)
LLLLGPNWSPGGKASASTRIDYRSSTDWIVNQAHGMGPMIKHRLGLLLIPFVGLLLVPLYNFHDPVLFGFPFFYWYQLVWVPVTVFLIWISYRSYPDEE